MTYKEAVEIAERNQDLVGKKLKNGQRIDYVFVMPSPDTYRDQFLKDYTIPFDPIKMIDKYKNLPIDFDVIFWLESEVFKRSGFLFFIPVVTLSKEIENYVRKSILENNTDQA
jgi:hypothetical protein